MPVRALSSGLSPVQMDNHGITLLFHLLQYRPCIGKLELGNVTLAMYLIIDCIGLSILNA